MKTVEPGLLDNLAHGRIYLLLIHTYILSLLKVLCFLLDQCRRSHRKVFQLTRDKNHDPYYHESHINHDFISIGCSYMPPCGD